MVFLGFPRSFIAFGQKKGKKLREKTLFFSSERGTAVVALTGCSGSGVRSKFYTSGSWRLETVSKQTRASTNTHYPPVLFRGPPQPVHGVVASQSLRGFAARGSSALVSVGRRLEFRFVVVVAAASVT